MSYSIDLRKRVISYIQEGHSKIEASRIFKVGRTTIFSWLKRSDLNPHRPMKGHNRKYDWDKLLEIVVNEPDRTLKEYSEITGMSISNVHYALKSNQFINKKNKRYIKRQAPKKDKNI